NVLSVHVHTTLAKTNGGSLAPLFERDPPRVGGLRSYRVVGNHAGPRATCRFPYTSDGIFWRSSFSGSPGCLLVRSIRIRGNPALCLRFRGRSAVVSGRAIGRADRDAADF